MKGPQFTMDERSSRTMGATHLPRAKDLKLGRPTKLLWIALLIGLTVVKASLMAQSPTEREYAIKAAFLFNFSKYVEWPKNESNAVPDEFRVGILGENPFGPALAALKDKQVNGRDFVVNELKGNERLDSYHLLFISASERGRLGEILSQLGEASVLTVSEVDGFANRGGMINLVAIKNRVKIEINQNAAEQANLSISPQLLKLAKIVKG